MVSFSSTSLYVVFVPSYVVFVCVMMIHLINVVMWRAYVAGRSKKEHSLEHIASHVNVPKDLQQDEMRSHMVGSSRMDLVRFAISSVLTAPPISMSMLIESTAPESFASESKSEVKESNRCSDEGKEKSKYVTSDATLVGPREY